jgi:hypothetical protein
MILKTAVLLFLFFLPQYAFPRPWLAKCSVGLMQDTNVFESFDRQESDRIGRVWLDVSGRFRPLAPPLIYANYSGGLDVYAAHTDENRLVHTLFGLTEIPLGKKTALGVEFQGKIKAFLNSDRGYGTWRAAPFFRFNPFDDVLVKASWAFSAFDFVPGKSFDYHLQSGSVSLESSPLPHVKWSLGFASYVLKYKRQAVRFFFPEYRISPWIPLGVSQKDRILEYSASVEAYCWAYWLFRFSYENNRSNSYGYSYRDPQFEAVIAKMLPWGLNLKLFWAHREKTYIDPLTPFLQVRPDAEDETDSQTLVDISKHLSEKWTARLRVVRYKNESPFRNLYYQKDVASLGCTYEF